MPPYRVEYLCRYRPVWRWDGAEFDGLDRALYEALLLVATGREARVVDACQQVLWPRS